VRYSWRLWFLSQGALLRSILMDNCSDGSDGKVNENWNNAWK
jgi:hypothetical protein